MRGKIKEYAPVSYVVHEATPFVHEATPLVDFNM